MKRHVAQALGLPGGVEGFPAGGTLNSHYTLRCYCWLHAPPRTSEVRDCGCRGGWGGKPALLGSRCPPTTMARGPPETTHRETKGTAHPLPSFHPRELLLGQIGKEKVKVANNSATYQSPKLVINLISHP